MSLEESIRTWVSLDNRVRQLTDELQRLREKRSEASEAVLDEARANQIMSARVRVSDGYLRFAQARTTAPLTLKYVESCLSRCIPDPGLAARVMRFIKEARPTKEETSIRRVVQKQED